MLSCFALICFWMWTNVRSSEANADFKKVFQIPALWANYLVSEQRQNIKPLGWQPAGGWSGQLNIPGSKPQTRMSCLPTNPPAPFCNSFSAICTWKISFSCFQVQTSHSSLSNTRTSFHVFSKRDQRGRLTRRFKDFSVTLLLTVSVKYALEHFLTDPIRRFYILNSTCLV